MFIVVKSEKRKDRHEIIAAATDAQAVMSVLQDMGCDEIEAETATARAIFRADLDSPAVLWKEDRKYRYIVACFSGYVVTV